MHSFHHTQLLTKMNIFSIFADMTSHRLTEMEYGTNQKTLSPQQKTHIVR